MNAEIAPTQRISRRRAPFIAILIKELKQNIVWATLGMLAFTLALCFMALTGGSAYLVSSYWTDITRATMPAAAIMGLGLGLLQILPERRRDLWSFLMHRPASPLLLFTGKAVAGTLLYALALGLPLLGAAMYAATPGHVAGPFHPGMTLVTVSAVIACWPFYFAGLLVALRPARWYATRILPAVAASILFILVAHNRFDAVWQVALAAVVFAGIHAVAAYGAFVRTDDYERQPRIARLALGITLYLSSFMAWASYLGSVMAPPILGNMPGDAEPEQFVTFSNGDAALMSQSVLSKTAEWVCNASGTPKLPVDYMIKPRYIAQKLIGGHPIIYDLPDWMTDRYALPLPAVDNTQNVEQWYIDITARQIVGYSTQSRRLVDVAGPNGFFPGNRRDLAGRFNTAFWFYSNKLDHGSFLIRHGSGLKRVSLPAHTVKTVAMPPTAGIALGSVSLWDLYNPSISSTISSESEFRDIASRDKSPASAVMTRSGVVILSRSGRTLFSIRHEYPKHTYPIVSIMAAPTAGQIYVLYQKGDQNDFATGWMSIWSADGRRIRSVSLPRMQLDIQATKTINYSTVLPAPMLVFPLADLLIDWNTWGPIQNIVTALPLSFFTQLPPGNRLPWCIAIGLACAVCALLIARRWGLPWKSCAVWAFAGFWLGVPGVLTFLSLRDWPARLPCPACRRQRVVSRENCEHCGALFSTPSRDGTEILGDTASPASSDIRTGAAV